MAMQTAGLEKHTGSSKHQFRTTGVKDGTQVPAPGQTKRCTVILGRRVPEFLVVRHAEMFVVTLLKVSESCRRCTLKAVSMSWTVSTMVGCLSKAPE